MFDKSRSTLEKLVKFFNNLELIVLAYVPLMLGFLMVIELFNRKFGLGFKGFFWLEELGRYTLVFITFLGASVAVKTGSHPTMDALYLKLPPRIGHILKGAMFFTCFLFVAYIDYYAWLHISNLAKISIKTSTLKVPLYIPYLPIGIFSILIFLRYLIASFNEFRIFFKAENHAL
jgi:C4-dicarboxylate transporter DctQ subunit